MPQIYRDDDHSTVVRKIAQLIEVHSPGEFKIETTPSEPVGSGADILLFKEGSSEPAVTIAIETVASLGAKTVSDRWVTLAAKATLQIYTPKGHAVRAKAILRRIGVKAQLIEY